MIIGNKVFKIPVIHDDYWLTDLGKYQKGVSMNAYNASIDEGFPDENVKYTLLRFFLFKKIKLYEDRK